MTQSAERDDVTTPWSRPVSDTLDELEVDPATGLSSDAVARRRQQYGPNVLRRVQQRSAFDILISQFKSLVVALLAVASVVALLFGQWLESLAIVAVLALNAAIGFLTEMQALRSMEALRQLSRVQAIVRRDGEARRVAADDLVPGDIVQIEAGDVVSADIRLIESSGLQANESAMTGESTPVAKSVSVLPVDTHLADRSNMLFKGTGITRGSALGVVVSTGMQTELGYLAMLVEQAEDEITPLERRLSTLGRRLVWLTLGIAVVVGVAGYIGGEELFLVVETAIALAIAAVPEGLPIIATIAMARGIRRMAQRNALIRRISSVETLGSTTIICTDKTGTLTENRLSVEKVVTASQVVSMEDAPFREGSIPDWDDARTDLDDSPALEQALTIGVLCNDASLGRDGSGVGDPLEIALLTAGRRVGIERGDLVDRLPEVRAAAFDPEARMMATVHKEDDRYLFAVKGGPEAVLDASTRVQVGSEVRDLNHESREYWRRKNEAQAENGLRVLALAYKLSDHPDDPVYEGLILVGLVALLDPPRQDVADTIRACRQAGIAVVMVTGDHPATAGNIAQEIGLVDDSPRVVIGTELERLADLGSEQRSALLESRIFARVTPEQKLQLIGLYREQGHIVAMTGDGVNDAPALKSADIGIAMGQRGTEVAREAADMVLQDDSLSSVVAAVRYGRIIFDNIRKFVVYLLSCNVSEVMVVGLAMLVTGTLPLLPLQILYLNLITDVFPALALGVGRGDPGIMKRPPRDPREPILPDRSWWAIAGYGVLITSTVLGTFLLVREWLDLGTNESITVTFLTLAFAQLWHVFNMRAGDSSILRNDITRNPYVWGALLLSATLLVMAVYLPGLSSVLETEQIGRREWMLVILMSLVPLVTGQLAKVLGVGERVFPGVSAGGVQRD